MKNFLLLLFMLHVCSCTYSQQEIHLGKKYLGVYIDNGERQGFQYVDSTGTEYAYRYVTTTIYNDSTIPVQLNINLSKQCNLPCTTDSVAFRMFLLPRELTPDKIQMDASMSKELKHFLDTETKTPFSYDKVLKPKETCVMRFGTLTNVNYIDPAQLGLISKGHEYLYTFAHDRIIKQVVSTYDPFTLSLGIDFSDNLTSTNANCYLVIPVGQISFPDK